MKALVICVNIITLIAITTLQSCNKKVVDKKTEEKAEMPAKEDSVTTAVNITKLQFENAGIKLGLFQNKNLLEFIKATGKIEVPPQNHAKVSTYIGAVVKAVFVQEGSYVKKGQTILTLEHPDLIKLQEQYIEGKNHLSYLEKEFKRQKELYVNEVGSGKAYQEAESKFYAEKGKVASLKDQLSMLSISTSGLDQGRVQRTIRLKAPISGYIGNLAVSQGGYAEPNKTLLDITNNSELLVHLDIFEKDIPRLKEGQKILVNVPNQESPEMQNIEGEVYLIGRSVDNVSKTVTVLGKITDERKNNLLPGMFVNARINVFGKKAKALPTEAVVRAGKKEYVFMATDAWCMNPNAKDGPKAKSAPKTEMAADSVSLTYKMVEVKTGAAAEGYVSVEPLEQISDSTIMAVKGAFYLVSQLKSGETVGCCGPEEGE